MARHETFWFFSVAQRPGSRRAKPGSTSIVWASRRRVALCGRLVFAGTTLLPFWRERMPWALSLEAYTALTHRCCGPRWLPGVAMGSFLASRYCACACGASLFSARQYRSVTSCAAIHPSFSA